MLNLWVSNIPPNPPNYPLDPNNPPELPLEQLQAFIKYWLETYGWKVRPHEIAAHKFYKHQHKLRELTGASWAVDKSWKC